MKIGVLDVERGDVIGEQLHLVGDEAVFVGLGEFCAGGAAHRGACQVAGGGPGVWAWGRGVRPSGPAAAVGSAERAVGVTWAVLSGRRTA